MDRLDAQLVETVRVILPSPDTVLLGIVPVEMPVLQVLGEMIGVGFRRRGENTSGGELGILDEVGSGLAGGLGRLEDDTK